jgi:NTP pyrophosphatase (non-canonical NTP hydrolase)
MENMMDSNQTELCICCIEECGEVIQAITKALRFGIDDVHPVLKETNRNLIHEEIGDLLTIIEKLQDIGMLSSELIETAKIKAKTKKEQKWLQNRRTL